MRLGSGAAGLLATAGVTACSGAPAGFPDLVFVGADRVPHETFTWYGPIGNAYAADGTDPRVGNVGPGKICDLKRIVERPAYDEVTTETGELLSPGVFERTLFGECIEPGKDAQ